MVEEEYNLVAGLWKKMMLDFEERLRVILRNNQLDYKTFKELDKGFDFPSIAAFNVAIPALSETFQPEKKPTPIQPTPQPIIPDTPVLESPQVQPSLLSSPTSVEVKEPPTPSPTITDHVVSPTPQTIEIEPPKSEPSSLSSLTGLTKSSITEPPVQTPTPSIAKISPGVPKVPTAEETPISKPVEEDRATGIAILRQQMLSELKKIRGIIETKEEKR